MKILEIITHKKIGEQATAGATSSGNIATVTSPHVAIGKDRGNKSYIGSPGRSGTKAPKLPKIVQKKNKDGTAKPWHELGKGTSMFGGPVQRRPYP